jgi:hypothetical protein
LKLCNFFSLLQCVVLSPSQSLNLKALSRTLDETKVSSFQGVVRGKTLVVFFTACVRNARSRSRRAWPSASSSTGGAAAAHTHVRQSATTAWDPSQATAWVPSAATTWGASAATTWGASAATAGFRLQRPHGFRLRRPHGFCLQRLGGALDMLHRNEEHALKSLHVD